MNYEAIEVYARAAREIEALKQTGEMKSSAGYLVGKLRKAIEMEAGIEAHEDTSAWLRSGNATVHKLGYDGNFQSFKLPLVPLSGESAS